MEDLEMNARQNQDPESIVRDIRRKTRRKFSAEEKIGIYNTPKPTDEYVCIIARKTDLLRGLGELTRLQTGR